MKILIVDDSNTMRRIVRRTLAAAGFDGHEIIEAENGAIALEKVVASPPDLILADWNMPQMTGIQLLQALRGQGIGVPFGFVTSEGTDVMREEAKAASAAFFLTKPFTAEDMAGALKEHIR
jgi:two-component system, chemotaxis family, chemotaxis protein CheY